MFEDLLLPIRGYVGRVWTAFDFQLYSAPYLFGKQRILDRDGVVSPIGVAIDSSAAEEDLENAGLTRIRSLEVTNIMPHVVCNHSTVQMLLSVFAGTNVESKLDAQHIKSLANLFCTDQFSSAMFKKFFIGVECLGERYRLRYSSSKPYGGCTRTLHPDGEEVTFGAGPRGHAIELPDRELCNIHLAIGRVLHASGVGEVIDNLLADEAGLLGNDAGISAFSDKITLKRAREIVCLESYPNVNTAFGLSVRNRSCRVAF
ncbi:hypothetical protein V1506DRAFT_47857 [Lipomyces tetrasporus]